MPSYPDPDTASREYFTWSQSHSIADGSTGTRKVWAHLEEDNEESESVASSTEGSVQAQDISDSDGNLSHDDAVAVDDDHVLLGRSRSQGRRIRVTSVPTPQHLDQENGNKRSSRRAGKGRKGVKRGLRRPIEPGPEFKAHLSKAVIAFANTELERAEVLTLKALQLNPEIFQAHSLLSEIHHARGDTEKALSAAWNGAHTKPRDINVWARLASLILEGDRGSSEADLRDAIYCYSRIISIDSHATEARFQRARLNKRMGHKKKAATEYETILKAAPHDLSVLRHLAEVLMELNSAADALGFYESAIHHYQMVEPTDPVSFTWSDVNIVVELYEVTKQFDKGIKKLKDLSRWMLGRKNEEFWARIEDDDREWDLTDYPRRISVPEYVPHKYDGSRYGEGLPPELRIKLGVFRLSSRTRNLEEAYLHFSWLDSDQDHSDDKVSNYSDLFREAAQALQNAGCFQVALKYYGPLRDVSESSDLQLLINVAKCYSFLGKTEDAEDCYETILRMRMPNKQHAYSATLNADQTASQLDSSSMSTFPDQRMGPTHFASPFDHLPQNFDATLDTRHIPDVTVYPGRTAPYAQDPREVSFGEKEIRVKALRNDWRRMQKSSIVTSVEKDLQIYLGSSLIAYFRQEKFFYPVDRHHRFYGYSKDARAVANSPKFARTTQSVRPELPFSAFEVENTIPNQYMGIAFEDWLEIFLETSFLLAAQNQLQHAYDNLQAAFDANVYYHSSSSKFSIQICRMTCALLNNAEEDICNTARWFMNEYQFVTDGYHLFSAVSRLCEGPERWYNSAPSQKYLLRQLKAIDFSLATRKSNDINVQKHTRSRAESSKSAEESTLDTALLMLYGYLLYAGKSYSYAVNYFLRALAMNQSNPTIKLSLAAAYIHWGLKRQAENRHHLILQGLAFLRQYREDHGNVSDERRCSLADYNVARLYHLLGLANIAIRFYAQSLACNSSCCCLSGADKGADWNGHAVLALQTILATNGDMDGSLAVSSK